jgi:CheY-like chemotaxis protein
VNSPMTNNMMLQKQELIQQYKDRSLITTPKRILIVNYEDDVNFALKLVLEEQTYNGDIADKKKRFKVDCFNDPFLALRSFKNGIYDLIIIGVMMPRMNGFELSKIMRRIDENVKICFLTAGQIPSNLCGYSSLCTGSEEHNHDKFISLPIENRDLVERLDGIFM